MSLFDKNLHYFYCVFVCLRKIAQRFGRKKKKHIFIRNFLYTVHCTGLPRKHETSEATVRNLPKKIEYILEWNL